MYRICVLLTQMTFVTIHLGLSSNRAAASLLPRQAGHVQARPPDAVRDRVLRRTSRVQPRRDDGKAANVAKAGQVLRL